MLGTRAISILLDRLSDAVDNSTKLFDLSGTVGTAAESTGTTTAASEDVDYPTSTINTVTLASPAKEILILNLDAENHIQIKVGGNWVTLEPNGTYGDSLKGIKVVVSEIQIMSEAPSAYKLLVTE